MNSTKLFLFFLCLSFSFVSYGQKFEKVDSITALKLSKKLAEKFRSGFKIQSADVDKRGVMRPLSGYGIVYIKGKKQFVIKPVGSEVPMTDNVEVREIGGITMVCHCGFGGGDDCRYYPVPNGSDTNHYCGGTCYCNDFCFLTDDSVLQYETMDGGWH